MLRVAPANAAGAPHFSAQSAVVSESLQIYRGEEPYLFVSYAHSDADTVVAEMTWLHQAGFRLWYDDGIHIGTIWRQAIADALAESAGLLFFATESSIASDNCNKEISFALDEGKPVVVVRLDDTELPRALRLSLADRQALTRADFGPDDYRERLIAGLTDISPPEAGIVSAGIVPAGVVPASASQQSTCSVDSSIPTDVDVFLACAAIDNQPLSANEAGWITEFERQLALRVRQLSGKEVTLSLMLVADGAETAHSDLPALHSAKALVVVMTPSFVRSDAARRVVEAFWQSAQGPANTLPYAEPRLFKVVKTPGAAGQGSQGFESILDQVRTFEFFEEDHEAGRVIEYNRHLGDTEAQKYHARIYDVAQEVHRTLTALNQPADASDSRSTVYVAETTSDVADAADAMRRELLARGYRVVPDRALPLIAGKIDDAVRSHLADVDLVIHPIGGTYGIVPEDSELSVPELQYLAAKEVSKERRCKQVIWIAANTASSSEHHQAFVERLQQGIESA